MHTLFYFIPKFVLTVIPSGGLTRLMILLKLYYFVFLTKCCSLQIPLRLPCRVFNTDINYYICEFSDLCALKEIYFDKEYEWFPNENLATIIDLGSNFGDTALYYHAKYPDAKIYAIEASPKNYEKLLSNVNFIPNIIPVHCAIGPQDGEIELFLTKSSLGHSVYKRDTSSESVTIPQMSINSLFKKYNITKADLIKFDIEGAEFDLFKESSPEQFADAYIGEVHQDLHNTSLDSFKAQFSAYTYVSYDKITEKRGLLKARII